MILKQKDIDRFWSKVDILSDEECWNWKAGRNNSYGCFWLGHYGSVGAHVVAYFITHGEDSYKNGMHIHHTCDNKICCNPSHLSRETAYDHMMMGNNIVALQARQTHCYMGHEFTPENTYEYKGMRHCRMCHRSKQAAYIRKVGG